MRRVIHPIIEKIINAPVNTYIIFFTYDCPYCRRALDLLKRSAVAYKGYDINAIQGGMPKLLDVFNQNNKLINFNPNHRTKPIIFNNGIFVGGYTELSQLIG